VIKAQLVALDDQSRRPKPSTRVVVQFNPETLHISYAAGASTLRMQLWFDVSASTINGDVRQLTSSIARFVVPRSDGGTLPVVRFTWGTFQFDGTLDSMDETLEFFSADGRPLRAILSLVLTSDHIQAQFAR
jgi:Contractile injection system tube protein